MNMGNDVLILQRLLYSNTFYGDLNLIGKHFEGCDRRSVVGNRMCFVPRAAGILEEILTRIRGRIHRSQQGRRCGTNTDGTQVQTFPLIYTKFKTFFKMIFFFMSLCSIQMMKCS